MIRIVFITTSFSTGVAKAMLLTLMEHIDRQRFEPHIISLISKGEIGHRIEKLNCSEHYELKIQAFAFGMFVYVFKLILAVPLNLLDLR